MRAYMASTRRTLLARKFKSAPKIAAVALAAAALGTVTVPVATASAAGGPSYFGVKTVYSETPSIFGFRGYFGGNAEGSNPGGGTVPGDNPGGGTTDPGTGGGGAIPGDGTDPGGDGGGQDLPYPSECTVSNAFTGWAAQLSSYDSGKNYLVPKVESSEDNPYGYSNLLDEAKAQGATITVGQGQAFLPQVGVYRYNPDTKKYKTTYYYDVDFSEFNPYVGTAKAVPAGTMNKDDYFRDSEKAATDYGSIEISDLNQEPIGELMRSESLYKKLDAQWPSSTDPSVSTTYTVSSFVTGVRYPVSISWPAGSKYSKCNASADFTYSISAGDA